MQPLPVLRGLSACCRGNTASSGRLCCHPPRAQCLTGGHQTQLFAKVLCWSFWGSHPKMFRFIFLLDSALALWQVPVPSGLRGPELPHHQ